MDDFHGKFEPHGYSGRADHVNLEATRIVLEAPEHGNDAGAIVRRGPGHWWSPSTEPQATLRVPNGRDSRRVGKSTMRWRTASAS